ncbi:hypothetical protein RFI_10413 [Reticulomyxa filosa]|uniref:Uncharacterized protein n=1 Tax=Reticulomyxa filosa TaxID=46433 RepID=X6NL50_RETFI|nr:hypothetical protein RFI_10413 [Reticulomyxa filosa]|eukprot:ETO26721.1 hypothetical protein RFI_10413 [Reticulomyxa filosa]
MFRGDQGCILHFHPSMRRALGIFSCDVSWISPFKHEREILFAKSLLNFINDENTHKKTMAWNANVENEDEYTQMILLTWTEYDEHIQQIVRVNEMFNYSIDFNLIYFVLKCNKKNIIHTRLMLHAFEKWRRNGNDKKYKERMKEFVEERCCNYNINLFCMFLSEKKPILNAVDFAKSVTVSDGLPFVEKDRNLLFGKFINISFFLFILFKFKVLQNVITTNVVKKLRNVKKLETRTDKPITFFWMHGRRGTSKEKTFALYLFPQNWTAIFLLKKNSKQSLLIIGTFFFLRVFFLNILKCSTDSDKNTMVFQQQQKKINKSHCTYNKFTYCLAFIFSF